MPHPTRPRMQRRIKPYTICGKDLLIRLRNRSSEWILLKHIPSPHESHCSTSSSRALLLEGTTSGTRTGRLLVVLSEGRAMYIESCLCEMIAISKGDFRNTRVVVPTCFSLTSLLRKGSFLNCDTRITEPVMCSCRSSS